MLEWVAISFSRGSSRAGDQTRGSALQVDFLPLNHQESQLQAMQLQKIGQSSGLLAPFLKLLDFSIFCLILIYMDSQLRVVNSKTLTTDTKLCSLFPCMFCPVSLKADLHNGGGDDIDEVMNYRTFITKQTQTFPNSFLHFCFCVALAPLDPFLKCHWLTEGRGNSFLSSLSLFFFSLL